MIGGTIAIKPTDEGSSVEVWDSSGDAHVASRQLQDYIIYEEVKF